MQRIFRLIATPVLMLGLLAFLIWGAFWGWRSLTAPLPTPEPTPCVTVASETVHVSQVSVRVFNGGFTSGLAYRQAQRLGTAGFIVVRTGNTDERITGTIIRANEANVPAIRLVTSYFKDVTFENDDRVDGTVDVYVGSDFAGDGDEPLSQVSSGSAGTICIPPTPESTESPEPGAATTEPASTDE